ncbi:MAG: 50S ribosomal protein L17 [Planctomycetota bacterium]
MRHRKKGRKLNRTASHREATRRNLAKALLEHERIITTPAKAKEAQSFVEKLITLARKSLPFKDSEDPEEKGKYLHYYRQAMGRLQDKEMVQKLFGEGEWREKESLAERYEDRPSGQTRIVKLSGSRLGVPVGTTFAEVPVFTYEIAGKERSMKITGNRLGDNAEQCIFELVEKEQPEEEQEVEPTISFDEDETLDTSDEDADQAETEPEVSDETEDPEDVEDDAETGAEA